MNIAIAGHNGYIVRNIKKNLLNDHTINNINREDIYHEEKLRKKIEAAEIIINFTGYTINKRWTNKNKTIKKSIIKFFAFIPGKGTQQIPFIRINDLISAIRFLIDNKYIKGKVNMVSPNLKTYNELIDTIYPKNYLIKIYIPKKLIFFILHKRADLIFNSKICYPNKLMNHHFTFTYS